MGRRYRGTGGAATLRLRRFGLPVYFWRHIDGHTSLHGSN